MAEPHRIFIVDDEERVLEGLRRALRRPDCDWRISFHQSSREALRTARCERPDVVVTDLRMPECDGFELITAMRRVAPDARYLILTGSGDFDAAVNAINDAQAFRFLTKPCPADDLRKAITDALEQGASRGGVAGGANPAEQAGLATLAFLPTAIVVVEAEGASVVFANAAAQKLLALKDGVLTDQHGRLRGAEQRHTERLHETIASAAGGVSDFVALPRASSHGELSVAAVRMDSHAPGRKHVALFITDPQDEPALDPTALGKLFDMTTAEARIALAIANGRDVAEAAALAGVTLSTARTYLKRTFAKTGATRQAELAKLILTAPAIRAGVDAPPPAAPRQ